MSRRDRPLFGILSVVSYLVSSYILFASLAKHHFFAPYHTLIIASAISGYSIAILLAWLSADVIGGAALTALAIAAGWLFDLKVSFYGSPLFILQFVSAFFIGYGFFLLRNAADRSCALRLEKMGEEINALTNTGEERLKSIVVLEEKLVRYATLKGVVESFSSVLASDAIEALILDKALNTIGKKGRALLYLVDVDAQELRLSASRDESRIKAKKGDLFDQWVLRHRRSLLVEDVTRDFRFPAHEAEEARDLFTSLIASPLINEDKVIGIIRMDSVKPQYFAQDDLRLLDIIANLGAVAIGNSYLFARTQELAIRDGLTGLFVRRYFMDRFASEIKRVALKQGDLSVLLLDIDHFKAYNDTYGHTAGDIVLKHLAGLIGALARDGDIVARYGGEEFVLVLPGRTPAQAAAEAEALRRAVSETPFNLRRHRTTLTVSIGVAQYPRDGVTEEALLNIADDRLYAAKRQGRNKVCLR